MVTAWTYLTLSVIFALIGLGVVAIYTAREHLEATDRAILSDESAIAFPKFVSAKLVATRVSEDAEPKDMSKRAEYLSINSTVLYENPKLEQALKSADFRDIILSKGGQLAWDMIYTHGIEINEEEANRLISIWKPYFIPCEISEQVYDNFTLKCNYLKILSDSKFYSVTITTSYER
jgi:hypothetical protein